MKLGKYKHAKTGKYYDVVGVAKHSETLEDLVIYKGLYNSVEFGEGQLWARPEDMFLEKVKLDYKSFRTYLRDKFNVTKAIVFMGYIPKFQKIYDYYTRCGFEIVFKEVSKKQNGEAKGNIDAELVLESARIRYDEYDKAVIVSSDGDFACLINYLKSVNKFHAVVSTRGNKRCSALLKKASKSRITYLPNIIDKINTTRQ